MILRIHDLKPMPIRIDKRRAFRPAILVAGEQAAIFQQGKRCRKIVGVDNESDSGVDVRSRCLRWLASPQQNLAIAAA